MNKGILVAASLFVLLIGVVMSIDSSSHSEELAPSHLKGIDPDKVNWREKSDEYWKESLDPERYTICRKSGTEYPFTGKYCATKAQGDYHCACCGQVLFSSKGKFDSGTGWPSFSEAAKPGAIEYIPDNTHGMTRTEVKCNRCGAHLGHVFDDGPPPSGKRYCINSICLYQKEG